MLVYDEEMGEFYNLAPIEGVSAGGGTRYLLNSGDGIWCGSEFPQTMPPLRRHRVIPCPPPPRIAAALELADAVRERMDPDLLNVANDAGYVETWQAIRRIMRKILELDKPDPEPVKDEVGENVVDAAHRLERRCEVLMERGGGFTSTGAICRAIAEELAAMKGGGNA